LSIASLFIFLFNPTAKMAAAQEPAKMTGWDHSDSNREPIN